MKHYSITFQPEGKTITIHHGATILEAASQASFILNTICGGTGTCGKCKVILLPDNKEVLACSHKIESDLTVLIPADSRFFEQKILEHGIDRQVKLEPVILKKFITSKDIANRPIESILNAVTPENIHIKDSNIAKYIESLTANGKGLTAVCHKILNDDDHAPDHVDYKLIAIEHGNTTDKLYGIAVDLGTTTIVGTLIDITDGQSKAVASTANPQICYGDDVISRILMASNKDGQKKLHSAVIDGLNMLIKTLCEQAKIAPEDIYELVLAGNTTMSHLFLNLPVEQLGQAPYKAHTLDACDRKPNDLAIHINPDANIRTIENIAGFIGSDTTAVALAVGMDCVDKITLVVDIGTNGELILGTSKKMVAASCAAGPALEGAKIAQGSRAIRGAIERVIINDEDIDLDIIGGNVPPRTICGSGLIDAVAVMLDLDLLDETGRFTEPETVKDKLPEKIFNRLTTIDDAPAFILAHNKDNDNRPVTITQKDIREIQLAKAAIKAGIVLLQKEMSIGDDDIDEILLAGAFGNYIRRQSALRIGMLPNVHIEKIRFVGNAASTGAQMVLLSSQCRELCKELTEKIKYVEIAHSLEFQMVFAEALMFEPN